jgi:hypothetical protein
MPKQVRRPGTYRILFAATAGTQEVRRTTRMQIVARGGPSTPAGRPVEIVVTDSPDLGPVAGGLGGAATRVVQTTSSDQTFDAVASERHNVSVVVVDVDRYGLPLVRDLRIVFPSIRIIALSNDPKRRAAAMKNGAAAALPRSAPSAQLTVLIRRLASGR